MNKSENSANLTWEEENAFIFSYDKSAVIELKEFVEKNNNSQDSK